MKVGWLILRPSGLSRGAQRRITDYWSGPAIYYSEHQLLGLQAIERVVGGMETPRGRPTSSCICRSSLYLERPLQEMSRGRAVAVAARSPRFALPSQHLGRDYVPRRVVRRGSALRPPRAVAALRPRPGRHCQTLRRPCCSGRTRSTHLATGTSLWAWPIRRPGRSSRRRHGSPWTSGSPQKFSCGVSMISGVRTCRGHRRRGENGVGGPR